jgi:peptidyl-prolyl cis-trans isomerase C
MSIRRGFKTFPVVLILVVLAPAQTLGADEPRNLLNGVCRAVDDGPSLTPLATRGGAVIYKEEIAGFLETMPPEHAAYFVNSDHIQKRLQQLTIERLIALDGVASGVLEDARSLGRAHSVVSSLLASQKRKEVQASPEKSALEGRARELYLADSSRFSEGSSYTFEHILIRTRDRSDLDSAKLMIDVHERLTSGEEFSSLRREYSEDQSQPDAGYEDAPLDQWPEKFRQALTSTEPRGQVIGPFTTEMGWHLVKYVGAKPGDALDWDEDKEKIIERVRQQEAAAAERRYIRDISTPPYIVDESALQELREEFSQ